MHIRAYGRDERTEQMLSKLWRFVWYEDSGPAPYLTRLQQVEHEAYAIHEARRAGVEVPDVLTATTAGPGTAILVERCLTGSWPVSSRRRRSMMTCLIGCGEQPLHCVERGVAHGALDLAHLLVAAGDVIVTDFGSAATAASQPQLDADAARLLAATTVAVGQHRAIAAARRALGPDGLANVLPYLQAPVLTDRVRHIVRHTSTLPELRAAAAGAAGTTPPPLVQLERVRPRRIALVFATLVGVSVLLGQLADYAQLREEIGSAGWAWLAVAAGLAATTNVAYALAYAGSTMTRVPFGRTVLLQLAGSFTNVVAPNGVATAAINARFLQTRGTRPAAAIAATLTSTAGSAVTQVGLFVAVLPAVGSGVHLSHIPWRGLAAVGCLPPLRYSRWRRCCQLPIAHDAT